MLQWAISVILSYLCEMRCLSGWIAPRSFDGSRQKTYLYIYSLIYNFEVNLHLEEKMEHTIY